MRRLTVIGVALGLVALATPSVSDECAGCRANHPLPIIATAADAAVIAEIYVRAIYGPTEAKVSEPFSAQREGRAWKVTGHVPPENIGGSYVVVLDAFTGCLLSEHPER